MSGVFVNMARLCFSSVLRPSQIVRSIKVIVSQLFGQLLV